MQKLLSKLFFFCSYLPLIRYSLENIYMRQLDYVEALYKNNDEVDDILLLTHLPDFVFGRSQFTLLIVTKQQVHPKAFLNQFREKLRKNVLSRVIFNLNYIPVLNEKEFRLDLLRGFLIRNSLRDTIKWKSLIKKKDYVTYLGRQNEFAIKYSSFQNLSLHFLRLESEQDFNLQIKNIKRSLNNLKKYEPNKIPDLEKFNKRANLLIKYPILKPVLKKNSITQCWKILTHFEDMLEINAERSDFDDPQLNFLKDIKEKPFIEDIFVTPSIIQFNPDRWQGKMYVDIILNRNFSGKRKELIKIKKEIKKNNSNFLKFRVRFTTPLLFEVSGQTSLYPFPLEPLLRNSIGRSISGREYPFMVEYEQLIHASIHFLVTQFMRFRSLKQKNELIGSKYIKSLNLMYRYLLLVRFLEGERFELTRSVESIRASFTPQLTDILLTDPVTNEDWTIIQAQLKYLLKKIRINLAKYDDSLYELRF